MKVLVYNFKGGVGKTSIGLGFALSQGYSVVTNDVYSPLEKILPKERLVKLPLDGIVPKFPKEFNIVFDFGGHIDARVIDAARQVDKVLIPTMNSPVDLQITLQAIREMEKYNKNIFIVANNLEKGDLDEIEKVMAHFFTYPIIPLKRSKVFRRIFEQRESIDDIARKNPLARYAYRNVLTQFNDLINTLTE